MLKIINDGLKQIRDYSFIWALAYGLLFILFVAIALQPYIPISELMRDTVDLAQANLYTGIISDVGIYLWFCNTTICLFAALVLQRTGADNRIISFFIFLSLINLYFGLDDRLRIHDELIDGGEVLYVLYMLSVIYFTFHYRKTILDGPYSLYVLAFLFMGMSVGIDTVKDLIRLFDYEVVYETIGQLVGRSYDSVYEGAYLAEDAPKLLGIFTMLLYCACAGYESIIESIELNYAKLNDSN